MKKLWILLTSLLLALGLTSCGDKDSGAIEQLSRKEVKEAEAQINAQIKGKNNEEISDIIRDISSEENYGEEALNSVGFRVKNETSVNIDLGVNNQSLGASANVKLNGNFGAEFIVNVNKGAYAKANLNMNGSIVSNEYGVQNNTPIAVNGALEAEYVINNCMYIDAKYNVDNKSQSIQGYTSNYEIDEIFGIEFNDGMSMIRDLFDGEFSAEDFIIEFEESGSIEYKVNNGYLECRSIIDKEELLYTISESLYEAELGDIIDLSTMTENDITYDFVLFLDKNFVIAGFELDFSVNIPDMGKIRLSTSTGISFGNFDYKGIENKAACEQNYLPLGNLMGDLYY